jgi:hypothetical protein
MSLTENRNDGTVIITPKKRKIMENEKTELETKIEEIDSNIVEFTDMIQFSNAAKKLVSTEEWKTVIESRLLNDGEKNISEFLFGENKLSEEDEKEVLASANTIRLVKAFIKNSIESGDLALQKIAESEELKSRLLNEGE